MGKVLNNEYKFDSHVDEYLKIKWPSCTRGLRATRTLFIVLYVIQRR